MLLFAKRLNLLSHLVPKLLQPKTLQPNHLSGYNLQKMTANLTTHLAVQSFQQMMMESMLRHHLQVV
jgi:hypothetical protein